MGRQQERRRPGDHAIGMRRRVGVGRRLAREARLEEYRRYRSGIGEGYDVTSPVEPDPSATLMEGPITHAGQVVGYFEIHGDDSVVIKDAEKKVVSTH